MLITMVSCNKRDGMDFTNLDGDDSILSTNNCTFSHEESKSLKNGEEPLPENTELIQSERYFQIYQYKNAVNKHFYRILNSNGSTVISETTTRPLSISIIEDNIIDISIGFGTGVCYHRYYNINKDILSELFGNVFATSGELIAYMNVPKENAMESRTLIIQNIFNTDALLVEYKLNFSEYVIPIEKIEFLKDSSSLQITYYKGDEQKLTTEVLNYNLAK